MPDLLKITFRRIITLIVSILPFTGISGQISGDQSLYRDFLNSQFNKALIEGTTQFLLQNYADAAKFYDEAIKYKPENGAVNYEYSQMLIATNNMADAAIYARKAYLSDKENIWYILNLANVYQNIQRYDSAVVLIEKAIVLDPQKIEYKYLAAGMLEKTGNFNKALYYLDELEKQTGVLQEIVLEKYKIYLSLNKGEEALKELRKASGVLTDDYTVNGILAEYYHTVGKDDSAMFYYKRIIPGYIDVPEVAISYATFLLDKNMPDTAALILEKLFRNKSTPKELISDYLKEMIKDEKYKAYGKLAETLSEIGYERFPDDINILSLFADIQYNQGNMPNLEKALKGIVNLDNVNYVAWEQLLYVESNLNNVDSLIKYGLKANGYFKSRPVPYYYLGAGYMVKKDYQKSIGFLETGSRLADNPALELEFYSLMAECYYNMKGYQESWKAFDKALEIDPANVIINNNYAYYLAEQDKNLDKALQMSNVALKGNQENVTYLDTYAWILYKMKQTSKAKKILKKVVKTANGKDAEIMMHYGDILYSCGKYNSALKYWEESMKYDSADKEEILKKIKAAEEKRGL